MSDDAPGLLLALSWVLSIGALLFAIRLAVRSHAFRIASEALWLAAWATLAVAVPLLHSLMSFSAISAVVSFLMAIPLITYIWLRVKP